MSAAGCWLVLAGLRLARLGDPDAAVTAGRQALDRWRWGAFPWYDRSADGVRPIDLSEPWYMKWDIWDRIHWPDWLRRCRVGGWPDSLLEWAAWIAIAAMLIVLGCLLARAFRMRQKEGPPDQRVGPSDEAEQRRRLEALPSGRPGRPADLLDEARRQYEQGNYREAIIYLFSHQLVQLDRHRLIRLTKGKTNRQYLRELGRQVRLRRLVQQTMEVFEEVFFGNYPLGQQRFESCWARLAEFDSLVAEAAG